MKIRNRIALVAVVVTLPQLLGLWWWDAASRHTEAARVLGSIAERAIHTRGARQACEDDPEAFVAAIPGPGPGPREGRPRRGEPGGHRGPPPGPPPGAPPGPGVLPPVLLLGGDLGEAPLGQPVSLASTVWSNRVEVGVRTGWNAPCDVLRVRGTTVPGFLGSVLPATPVWLAPIVLVATLMWLAVAPPVNRIRRLTARIRNGERRVAVEGDDEIAELARAFEASAVELEQREQALQAFVSNTAHDMRIPLTVLRGHLVSLEDAPDGQVLELAMGEVHYLSALLDDLAAHARMEAASPHEPVELGSVVRRVVARHAPIARRRQIELHHGVPEEGVWALGDLTLVEQALSNLVYNAIHYNRAGGNVAITLDTADGDFEVRVTDDGPGVPEEELRRLTERGYRGDQARGRDLRGSGLGLSIVERVAHAHGWRFVLRNLDGGGLCALLEGPLEHAPAA